MAVASPPSSVLPAGLMLSKIELEVDDPRHQSVPGAHSGDPSRVARLTATAAPNNVLRPPAQLGDPNLSAKREVRGGQGSKRCDAQRQYLRRGECAATLPIVAPRLWPSEPYPARALEAQHQAYTNASSLAHRTGKRPGRVSSGRCVSRHRAVLPSVSPLSYVSFHRAGYNSRGERGVRLANLLWT